MLDLLCLGVYISDITLPDEAQVETLLQSQESNVTQTDPAETQEGVRVSPLPNEDALPDMLDMTDLPILDGIENSMLPLPETTDPLQLGQTPMPGQEFSTTGGFQWEMIGLGLEESLPNQDIIDELYVFFDQNPLCMCACVSIYFDILFLTIVSVQSSDIL